MYVAEFLWDEVNEEKVSAHGISPDDVDDVLGEPFATFRNRRGMRGAYQLVGRDRQGRYVTIIIEPVIGDTGIWRPVTAWPSKSSEASRAQQQGV